MRKWFKPADCIIYLAIIAFIIASSAYSPRNGSNLSVRAGDALYSFPLDKDAIYSVEGEIGKTEIEIKDGRARIISSPCPNKTCISSGFQNTLVCLPNKVIAEISKGDVDESTF